MHDVAADDRKSEPERFATCLSCEVCLFPQQIGSGRTFFCGGTNDATNANATLSIADINRRLNKSHAFPIIC